MDPRYQKLIDFRLIRPPSERIYEAYFRSQTV